MIGVVAVLAPGRNTLLCVAYKAAERRVTLPAA
jgi:hypothetical protein